MPGFRSRFTLRRTALLALLAPTLAMPLVWGGCGGSSATARPSPVVDGGPQPLPDASVTPPDAGVDAAPSCGDTTSDPKNCGACGHACLRGACVSGVCEPLPVVVLASGQQTPVAIGVDSTSVYWFNQGQSTTVSAKAPGLNINGQVMKCAKTGCAQTPTVLAGGIETESSPAFAVNDANVYWSQITSDGGVSGSVHACATGGCGGISTELAPGFALGMAADSTRVYWSSGGSMVDCASGGCGGAPSTFFSVPATGDPASAVALDDTTVYWATRGGSVLSCPKTGCGAGPTVLTSRVPTAAALTVDANNVYWVVSNPLALGEVFSCAKTGCGIPSFLVTSLSNATTIATDGTNVYWGESGNDQAGGDAGAGRVAMCAVTGCSDHPTTLVDGLENPVAVAVDDVNVYFATTGGAPDGGTIQRIAK